jgi:4'-phosphopantetheinyl transferase
MRMLEAVDSCASSGVVIHLWLASLDKVAPAELELYQGWFTPSERLQFSNFLSDRRCREFIIGRGLARLALSSLCGAQPEHLEFEASANGKLIVTSPSEGVGLHFSISHTSDIVVCAACGSYPVGVDVERIAARAEPLTLAARFFSSSEHSVLSAVDEKERLDRFFLMWTLKEALAKSHGLSVLTGTDTTHFDMSIPGVLEAYCWEPQFREAWLASAAPGAHHRLALCVLCEDSMPVHLRVERDQTGWEGGADELSWHEGRLQNRPIQT